MTTDDLLQQGIAALKAGRKAEARNFLLQLIDQDERNEMAWLWLSGAVDNDAERYTCLRRVLEINPYNGTAQRGMESLRKRSPGLTPAPVMPLQVDRATPQRAEKPAPGGEFQPTTTAEINEILRQAVDAIKAGEKEQGKQLLIEVLRQDEENEAAWLWMTRCVTERDVKRECFERVLEINPDSQHAVKGLKRLDALSKVEKPVSAGQKKASRKQTR